MVETSRFCFNFNSKNCGNQVVTDGPKIIVLVLREDELHDRTYQWFYFYVYTKKNSYIFLKLYSWNEKFSFLVFLSLISCLLENASFYQCIIFMLYTLTLLYLSLLYSSFYQHLLFFLFPHFFSPFDWIASISSFI